MSKFDETVKRRDARREQLLADRATLLEKITLLGEFDADHAKGSAELQSRCAAMREACEAEINRSWREFAEHSESTRKDLSYSVITLTRAVERGAKDLTVLTSEVVSLAHADLAGVVGSARQALDGAAALMST